jgi:hypothetical protein
LQYYAGIVKGFGLYNCCITLLGCQNWAILGLVDSCFGGVGYRLGSTMAGVYWRGFFCLCWLDDDEDEEEEFDEDEDDLLLELLDDESELDLDLDLRLRLCDLLLVLRCLRRLFGRRQSGFFLSVELVVALYLCSC